MFFPPPLMIWVRGEGIVDQHCLLRSSLWNGLFELQVDASPSRPYTSCINAPYIYH